MIKAVVFDYFGVVSSDTYWRFVRSGFGEPSAFAELSNKVNTGLIDWQEFVQHVAQNRGVSVDNVESLYEAEQLDPRVVRLIVQLKMDYKVGLLTNAHHDYIDGVLERNHLDELFDAVVVSSREGVVKPDPRIYDIAATRLGVAPKEVVFIDDNGINVAAATEQGMQGLEYATFDQVHSALIQMLQKN